MRSLKTQMLMRVAQRQHVPDRRANDRPAWRYHSVQVAMAILIGAASPVSPVAAIPAFAQAVRERAVCRLPEDVESPPVLPRRSFSDEEDSPPQRRSAISSAELPALRRAGFIFRLSRHSTRVFSAFSPASH